MQGGKKGKKNLAATDSVVRGAAFAAFVSAVAVAVFLFIPPPPRAPEYARPFGEKDMETVTLLAEKERRIEEMSYDGTMTERIIREEIFPFMRISSVGARASADGAVIEVDVRGVVSVEHTPRFFLSLDRPGMRINSIKMSSSVNFSHTGTDDLDNAYVDTSLSLSLIRASKGASRGGAGK